MVRSDIFDSLSLVFALVFFSTSIMATGSRANELAIGKRAKGTSYTDISVNGPECINFKSKDEILRRRKQLVQSYPQLLAKPYHPNREVFGQIQSGKPWWGLIGGSVYGSGKKSILGPSEETRFLYNPYLLVGTLPWANEIWEAKLIRMELFKNPRFPFFWEASLIRIHPKSKTVQIVYEVSKFDNAIEPLKKYMSDKEPIVQFGLSAYNARDFGYNYIFLSKESSKNIINKAKFSEPLKIRHYIHSGGSGGYPGGSNNMSPAQSEIDHLEFTELPARVCLLLWKNKPARATIEPDLTVFLELR